MSLSNYQKIDNAPNDKNTLKKIGCENLKVFFFHFFSFFIFKFIDFFFFCLIEKNKKSYGHFCLFVSMGENIINFLVVYEGHC